MALRPQALRRLPLGAAPRGVLPPPILLRQPLGVFQQPTDFTPDGHFHQIGAHLRVGTDPLSAKAIGVGPQTAIVRIGAGMAFATTRTYRFPIVGIATDFADQQALEQVTHPALALPRPAAILG